MTGIRRHVKPRLQADLDTSKEVANPQSAGPDLRARAVSVRGGAVDHTVDCNA